ncbi:MAG: superoxide dismutase [Cytophagales bacterium]|nr:MAG: superoxide dismutase [Rhodothermaeota bacterium MED-G16]|tara:strand:+ start:9720 stop:10316 length:597 start_codon:yes stop_codon:yes gene_type:complete
MAFSLPDLPYSYDALEPFIDTKTMEIHHQRHHNLYLTNLNNAIKDSDMSSLSIEDICKNHSENIGIRNNGGGHYNHNLFWNILSPDGGGDPAGKVKELIDSSFGSYENFKEKFKNAAMTRFGSGWAWLCQVDDHLEICSTANQDNPLMPGICNDKSNPLLGLDVWEHAYYLNYQNKRIEYIDAFYNLINWEIVNKRIK